MPKVQCKICQGEFYAKPNWLEKGWGKYCSRKCHHVSLKKGRVVECSICQKEIYKTRKALKGSKSRKFFCSKSCQTIWRNSILYIGSKHKNWKHGRYTHRNVLERNKIVPICSLCGNKDKRVMAVHHIDKNHRNNELDNLAWLCHNCHCLVHYYPKESKKFARLRWKSYLKSEYSKSL